MALGAHENPAAANTDWYTPPNILEKLGKFDLDPCCEIRQSWNTAGRVIGKAENGLLADWHGRVWMNPPFSREAELWVNKLAAHGNGIALLAARTDARWFINGVWKAATGVCFLAGRPHFHYPNGNRAKFNSGAPMCLVAYGEDNFQCLVTANLGTCVKAVNVPV